MLRPTFIVIALAFLELFACQPGPGPAPGSTTISRFSGRKYIYETLFSPKSEYDISMKPPDSTQVNFKLDLIKVLSLAEKDQIITLQVSINQVWQDSRLIWNITQAGNLTDIYVASTKVWV